MFSSSLGKVATKDKYGHDSNEAAVNSRVRLQEVKMKDEYGLEAKFYDKIWGRYDYNADVEFLGKLFREHDCRSVIDVGCGTGNHALRLSRMGYEVTGVDLSSTMLRIARNKDKGGKIRFAQGDMKALDIITPKRERFDAAISLGLVSSHLYTDREVRAFLNSLLKILKKNGLFVLSARNAAKIDDEHLNKLRLDHMISEEKMQLAILAQNSRDLQDPNTIVWRPIYLVKEKGKVDLQAKEHRLRWFEFPKLRKLLIEEGFRINAVYAGPSREKFHEEKHPEMWFIATAK
jgi:SAM-dependent methyltransferase